MEKNRKFQLQHWQIIAVWMAVYDACTIALSFILGLYLRFDLQFGAFQSTYGETLAKFLPFYVIGCLIIYYFNSLYRSIWRFSSYWELKKIIVSELCCLVWMIALSLLLQEKLPASVYVFGFSFQCLFAAGLRFLYRFVLLLRSSKKNSEANRKKAMVIGAGSAGRMILADSRKDESPYQVVCFIDDNPNKLGRLIDGVEVVGNRNQITQMVDQYNVEAILVAIPSADSKDRKEILNICETTGRITKKLPSLIDIAANGPKISSMRDIKMEDLLGRDSIKVNTDEILNSLTDKVILVTGGGGSIGSELCRQIASHAPRQLIILDIYENNAYDIQNELKRKYPDLNLEVVIASVRDTRRMNEIFDLYHPQVVYHAAAHKHVPLMEVSPCEAIKNNVIGTYKTAKAALEHGAERFLLISTDKAVNPTNIMGASKRLCEMVVQSLNDVSNEKINVTLPVIGSNIGMDYNESDPPLTNNKRCKTQFIAVRFGNVLGSNGSVIPLFEKQIENGGPVTVTHPEINRFFMTIPEAVSLVLQAGTYANGGEIFVLDMGEPVKINDLAKQLIRLHGYVPGEDIKIEYTGLRPGEKLYEEKLMAEEGLEKTENDLIHIGKPIDFDRKSFLERLPLLYQTAMKNDEVGIIKLTEEVVKTYKPDWNHYQQQAYMKKKYNVGD